MLPKLEEEQRRLLKSNEQENRLGKPRGPSAIRNFEARRHIVKQEGRWSQQGCSDSTLNTEFQLAPQCQETFCGGKKNGPLENTFTA
jgi:hypothetical protein